MPSVGGFFLGAFGYGGAVSASMAAGYAAGTAFAASTLGSIAIRLVTTVAVSALSAALQDKPNQGGGLTLNATMRGEQNPETIILGRTATGGQAICPPYSHGPSNRYLTQVVELCSAPGATLEGLILGGERVEIGTEEHPDYGLPILGDYDGVAWVRYYDGSQTAADPMLVEKYGAHPDRPWTEDMIGSGLCYAIVTLHYDQERMPRAPTLRFEMGGIPFYDIRKDSTAGGSGTHRLDEPATWEPSHNAIVQIWNIWRGIDLPGGDVWGGGLDPAEAMPQANWVAQMNKADAAVDLADGGSEPMYRAGIEAALTDAPASVAEELLKAASAEIADMGGYWRILAGAPDMPVYSFTDADIIVSREQEYQPFPGLSETYNAITAEYPDPASLWETRDAPPRTNAEWEAADTFGRRTANLQLSAVPYPNQVQRLMQAYIEDERRMRRHIFSLPPDAGAIELLDTVDYSSKRNGYENKDFSLYEIAEDLFTGVRKVSLRERDPADYDWSPEFELPNPPEVTQTSPAPVSVADFAAEGIAIPDETSTPRRGTLKLSWASDQLGDGLRWEFRLAGLPSEVRSGSTLDLAAGEISLPDWLQPGGAYEVRARLIAAYPTAWTGWIAVTTPDIRLTEADLADPLNVKIDEAFDRHDAALDDATGTVAELRGRIEQALVSLDLVDIPATPAIPRIDQDIADEVLARADADISLADDIATEETERFEADQALADDITEEASARLSATLDLAGNTRVERDRIRNHASEALEAQAIDADEREQIRQSLTVNLEDAKATFTQDITVLTDGQTTLSQQVTSLGAVTEDLEASVQIVDQARIDGDLALANQMALLSVGSAVQFDQVAIWHWDVTVEGWTGSPSAPSVTGDGWLAPASDSYIVSPSGLEVATSTYRQVRARLRNEPVTWADAYLYWADTGQDWDNARRIEIASPTWDGDETMLTINPDWSGTIDRIRLDLPDGVEIDWLAIGRPAPGASSAELAAESQARIDADLALAEDIVTVSGELAAVDGKADANADGLSALTVRVEDTENGLVTVSNAQTALNNQVNDPETGLSAVGDAVDDLNVETEQLADGVRTSSTSTRAVRSTLRGHAGETLEGLAQDVEAQQANREVVAQAAQDLRTDIELVDGELTVVAEFYQLLSAELGQAKATIEEMQVTKVDASGAVSAVNQQISAEYGDLSALAEATAFAKVTADGIASGHVLRLNGQNVWEVVSVADGTSGPTVSGRWSGDQLTLDGNTLILGDFEVSGGNVRLNADTLIDGSFQVTGDTVRLDAFTVIDNDFVVSGDTVVLDADTTILGGFMVSGPQVVLDAYTLIDGSFQVTGDTVRLDAFTVIAGDFTVTGQHVILDADTTILGGFTVSGPQVVLDADTVISGSFGVSGNTVTLDADTVIAGDFTVTGQNIVLDGNTTIGGQFFVRGSTVILEAATQVLGDFEVSGGNVRLTADTVVDGNFTVSHGMALFENVALQSDDFETGVSGWQISKDGDAEFNNLVVRGWVQQGAVSDGGQAAQPSAIGKDHFDVVLGPISLGPTALDQFWHFSVMGELRLRSRTSIPPSGGESQWEVTNERTQMNLQYRTKSGGAWSSWQTEWVSGLYAADSWSDPFTETIHFQGVYEDVEVRVLCTISAVTTASATDQGTFTRDNFRNVGLVAQSVVR